MKKYILILTILLTGCASIDSILNTNGVIKTHISKFDKAKIVIMSPTFAERGFNLNHFVKFGLYWEEKYGNNARLIVQIDRAANFSLDKNLEIKIDGKILSLKNVNELDFGNLNYDSGAKGITSEKDYIISKEQILQMANGKKGAYRLHLLKTYIDGNIDYYKNDQNSIPKPFKNFYSNVWGN